MYGLCQLRLVAAGALSAIAITYRVRHPEQFPSRYTDASPSVPVARGESMT